MQAHAETPVEAQHDTDVTRVHDLVQRVGNLVQRVEELREWYVTTRRDVLRHNLINRFIDDDVRVWTDAPLTTDFRELLQRARTVQKKATTTTRTINVRQLDNETGTYEQRLQTLRNKHAKALALARTQLADEVLVAHANLPLPAKLAKTLLPLEYTHTNGVTSTTLRQRVYIRWLEDDTDAPQHRIAVGYTADGIFGATSVRTAKRLPMYVLGVVTRASGEPYVLTKRVEPFLYDPDDVHAMYTGLGLPAPMPVVTMPAIAPTSVDINTFTTDLRNEFPEIRDVARVTQFFVEYESITDNKIRKRKRERVNESFVCEVAGIPATSGVSENCKKATQLRRWLRATRKRRKTTSNKVA